MEKYWYKTVMFFCPVCGDGETARERQYTPKPEKIEDRYETHEHYDYCNEGHF